MADYIYTMEIRLTPDQQKGVIQVQDIARNAGMNIYLTGGAVRDIISGFSIRDLDFTVQGNPLKLQKDLERAGASVANADEELKTLYLVLPGNVRAEITAARTERYEKAGKPPITAPATIIEDLRRRDFTVNAMALSLNPGSRGLLMDPFNGVADVELKVIRILHNYAFVEDPSRLIRATRFAARFHWPLEERTQARFQSAKENNYIEYISNRAIGHEIEQLAYEDDPLNIVRMLEKEGWLKALNSHWTTAKVDAAGLGQLQKTRQQMNQLGYTVHPSAAVLHFLTARLGDKDIAEMRRLIPRKDLVEAWKNVEDQAKDLTKRLLGKEAATPSRAWKLLSEARTESVLFLAVTARQQAVSQKLKNFFTKWREVRQKIPLPEMTELHITPQMPEYPKIAQDVFMLLLDGKLRSRNETLKYLKPLAPPPPPPPPPAKRGRGAKAAVAHGNSGGSPVVERTAGKKSAKPQLSAAPAQPAAKSEAADAGKVKTEPQADKRKSAKTPPKVTQPAAKKVAVTKPHGKKSSDKRTKGGKQKKKKR
jgi:tRNA nucleotidyltransferase (CCA-adding enzyme)